MNLRSCKSPKCRPNTLYIQGYIYIYIIILHFLEMSFKKWRTLLLYGTYIVVNKTLISTSMSFKKWTLLLYGTSCNRVVELEEIIFVSSNKVIILWILPLYVIWGLYIASFLEELDFRAVCIYDRNVGNLQRWEVACCYSRLLFESMPV